jgi:protein TonB
VEDNGVVTNVTVLRGVNGGPGLEKEAKRVLRAMPPWTPGRMYGKPVRVKVYVPVRFKLE